MISSSEFELYKQRIDDRDASMNIWRRASEAVAWRMYQVGWCPRCQQVVKWTHDVGKGYERMLCGCGLFFVYRDGAIYDISVEDR